MDGHDFLERVRSDEATALSRLGSDKYLIATTGADLSTGPVLATVARSAAVARDTFDAWAADGPDPAAAAFADAADTERDHYDRITGAMPDDATVPDDVPVVDAVADAMGASEDAIERVAAGLVGRALVADQAHLQVVSFFVNEADDTRADLARELRSDAQAQLESGVELLDTLCESDEDWDRARRAAGRVVADAYDDYAAALETMGVDPKPVC
jgi:hypothetical protein